MRKFLLSTILVPFFLNVFSQNSSSEFTVLQWNIWHEGTQVDGGYDAIVKELHRLSPDFVTLSEIRNYNDTDFLSTLTNDLKALGDTFYTASSYDSGLLSKYPIERFDTIYPHLNDHGTIHRVHTVTPHGHRLAIYTAHLDYLNCAYYEPRGYSGNTWERVVPPSTSEEVLYLNNLSNRDEQIKKFIKAAQKDIEDGRTIIIGGDFNEPSYLDWQENTASIRGHHGLVVPWTVSVMLHENGFTDAFREVYPNPVSVPGFTFPSANPDVAVEKLTWAPTSDERERIDFIYYKSQEPIKVEDAAVFGPVASVEKSRLTVDSGSSTYILPLGVWPTDHKGVLCKFRIIRSDQETSK